MKRTLIALAALLCLALPLRAAENCSRTGSAEVRPVCIALDAAAANTVSAAVLTAPYSEPSVQIWNDVGASISTITIQCRSWSTAPWYPCFTLNNVDAAGVYYTLPRAYQYRLDLAWVAGNISATFELYK